MALTSHEDDARRAVKSALELRSKTDLLEELARDLSDSRVCFVLAYRPPPLARGQALNWDETIRELLQVRQS